MKILILSMAFALSASPARAEEAPPAASTSPAMETVLLVPATMPAPAPEPALVEPAAPVALEEPVIARPKWLEKAGKIYAEGVKAQEAGRPEEARRKYAQALKSLADHADPGSLLSLKDEVADLFDKLDQQLAPPAPPDQPVPAHTLEVTPAALEAAPPAPPPPAPDQRGDYAIPLDPAHPVVKKFIALYTGPGPYRANLQASFDRMAVHRDMILSALKEQGLPRELVYLPLVESEYQPSAVSRAGATGLWQFMAVTGRNAGLKINYWMDERLDPVKCTQAALRHLKDLFNWFQDWPLALAAYNRGIYGLDRDMRFARAADFDALAKRDGLPSETQLYVPKLMACALIGDNAAAYGFTLPPSKPAPATDEIVLNKPLDLKIAAQCAGTTEAHIRALNPALRLWCTPKNEPSFALKVPKGTREKTLAALAQVKDWTPASDLVKYRVKQGDYLGRIASKFKTTVPAVMRDNRITDPKRLRPGQVLMVRPGRGYRGD